MKNHEILTLAEVLPLVDAPNMDGDFNYAISDNLLNAKHYAISINKAIEASEKVKEYEEKLKELQMEYAEKDDDGVVISQTFEVGGRQLIQYKIPGVGIPESEFTKAVEKLNATYKKDLDAHEKKKEYLQKENKQFKPLMINRKLIPNSLPRHVMDVVYLLVEKKDNPPK